MGQSRIEGWAVDHRIGYRAQNATVCWKELVYILQWYITVTQYF